MQLYIHRGGQQFGPYSLEVARDYLGAGNLSPSDLAWYEGATDWVPLSQVAGITAAVPGSPAAWIPPRRSDAQVAAASAGVPVTTQASASAPANRPKQSRSPAMDGFRRQQRAIGARNMGVGALFCVGGIVVTIVSYEAASSGTGGGTYLVTWGAIIFGGIQFIKGVIQFCKA